METRYISGIVNPIMSDVDSATVIAIGDLVILDTDDAKPASAIAWDTNIATTQEAMHDKFLGIADSRSQSGETEQVRVNTSGVFEFDCASATFELGALVGVAKASGDGIESQKVVAVATANLAIGRVAQRYGTATTRVRVAIDSVVMTGGPRAMASAPA